MADVPCLDHQWDGYKDFPDGVQITLHVEPSHMSNRITLDGRRMHGECTCNRNVHEPFLKCAQAHLMPLAPVFKSWHAQPFQ